MRRIWMATLLFSKSVCFSQTPIHSYSLQLTVGKTSNIIFPFPLRSVDRGSAEILVRKAAGVENILQLKAAKPNFHPTNVSVVTSDGRFYSFVLSYSQDPAVLNLSFSSDSSVMLEGTIENDSLLKSTAEHVCLAERTLHFTARGQDLKLRLENIFTDQRLLWFCFSLASRSSINTAPFQFRFFLRDRHEVKRTASQFLELEPVYHYSAGQDSGVSKFIFAFRPFGIPRKKQLILRVNYGQGFETLTLFLGPRVLHHVRELDEQRGAGTSF